MFNITVTWANGEISHFAVEKESVSLGRDPENDIYLPSDQASRKHALVHWQDGALLVEDLGSANGTYVGDQRVSGLLEMSNDDELKLADVVVTVSFEDSQDTPEFLKAPAAGESSVAKRLGNRQLTTKMGGDEVDKLRKMLQAEEET